MAFQDVQVEGGHDYAKTKRHYPLQDYHEVALTIATATSPASYVLFYGDNDFFICFNVAIPNIPLGLPLLIRIPANTFMRFHPHSAYTIYLAALLNVNVRIWMEG